MRIIRAAHLGWCFGVRDAVTLATRAARGNSVTVLGELVHNQQVNDLLRAQGVRLTRRVEEVTTATVIITAHGASEKALERVRARAPNVIEATCPLVRAAHDVVLTEADVAALPGRRRFGVAAQTTQPVDRVRGLVGSIQHRFPGAELRFVDTVCRPTKDRQAAAAVLARQCDVVVVIGGRHSSNTVELARTCARSCARVVRVETVADLRGEWFTDADTVGITAGTSTPDVVIDEVEQWLQELAAGQEVSRPAPDLEPHIA